VYLSKEEVVEQLSGRIEGDNCNDQSQHGLKAVSRGMHIALEKRSGRMEDKEVGRKKKKTAWSLTAQRGRLKEKNLNEY